MLRVADRIAPLVRKDLKSILEGWVVYVDMSGLQGVLPCLILPCSKELLSHSRTLPDKYHVASSTRSHNLSAQQNKQYKRTLPSGY
jgi:hypothetical protein